MLYIYLFYEWYYFVFSIKIEFIDKLRSALLDTIAIQSALSI